MREIKQTGCSLFFAGKIIFYGAINSQVIVLILQRILAYSESKLNDHMKKVDICN
jgi:hypothetical protein